MNVRENENSALIDALTADGKRALLGQILQSRRRDTGAVHPLSYGQQALYLLYLSAPMSAAYHMVFALRIQTSGNLAALRVACQALVDRHPVLRSRIRMQGGKPVQESLPEQEVCFEHRSAEGEQCDAVIDRAIEISQEPFDLAHGPVARFTVFSRTHEDHLFLLVLHHIVFDAWSLWMVLDELRVFYAAELAKAPAGLPSPQLTYADYVLWQREMLAGPAGDRLWAYWREQLAGELTPLDLPYDRPRPAVQTDRGAVHAFEFDQGLTQALQCTARDYGVTLFTLLLASFQVFLHRYSGQKDILVGSPAACRTQPEFQSLVGYLVNPVVFRADFSEDIKFSDHLARTGRAVLGGLAHQDFPFPLLVQRLHPRRDPSRSPIFQVMFVSQQAPLAGLSLLPNVEPVDIPQRLGQFDLVLESVQPGGIGATEARPSVKLTGADSAGALRFNLKYNTDLFDVATIRRMSEHMRLLFQAIVDNPHEQVSRLRLFPRSETRCLIEEARGIASRPLRPGCIHHWFEERAQEFPDGIAVVCDGERLTYKSLNARANQLARYLPQLGVGPEARVAICLPRGVTMVIAVLGVLKAGAAYVPLDPEDPDTRLAAVIADAKPLMILAMAGFRKRSLPETPEVFSLDDWGSLSRQPESNPDVYMTPSMLAYVIYTSGSTGAPQGVAVEHRQIANYVHAISDRCDWKPRMNFAMVQALTWDGCLTMLLGSLCTGGTLHVISLKTALDAQALQSYFAGHEIDCAKFTPSHFAALESSGPSLDLLPRRCLIFGGESPRCEWIRKLQTRDFQCRIYNHYGPTEATVGALIYRFDLAHDSRYRHLIPLGRPLANVSVYILDSGGQICPMGMPGEIYIGGAGVARQYLNGPASTAAKFVTDPFSTEPGARLFRSGDRGRYLTDGCIEFLGRLDDQMKIRGFRVEPQEVEIALGRHPGVREVVVAGHEQTPGFKRLVAYIVPGGSPRPSSMQLREFLSHRLPAYMCPSAFVFLDALPLKSSGKVDRESLPKPEPLRAFSAALTPRSGTEGLISRVWQECLGVHAISPDDNFFDLGGHSLLMIQVHSHLEDALGMKFSVLELFEHVTISSLAEHLYQHQDRTEPVEEGTRRGGKREAGRRTIEQQSSVRRNQRTAPAD